MEAKILKFIMKSVSWIAGVIIVLTLGRLTYLAIKLGYEYFFQQ